MKIAQIAPIIERIPPNKYGGIERVVYHLTEQLVKKGHEVTLFASGDSVTSAKLISVYPKALKESSLSDIYGLNIYSLLNMGQVYDMQDQFDVIHDHNGYISLPTANIARTPVVMTYHGPITPEVRFIHQTLRNPYIVSISASQQKIAPDLNWAETVYNGLEMSHYPFISKPDDYLLFVGRISEEKGVHIAIDVARRLHMPLIIAAKLEQNHKPDVLYFKERVEPYLTDSIRWIGEVNEEERNTLMSKAFCFLHPITWQEPFGLVLIESMACGTPVVSFSKGSIPEIISPGESGFYVSTVDEMVEAVKMVIQIDRKLCRNYALSHFNADRMADGYIRIYKKVIEQTKHKKTPQQPFSPVFPHIMGRFSKDNERLYAHTIRQRLLKRDDEGD